MDDNKYFNLEMEALSCEQIETTPMVSVRDSSRSQTEEPREKSTEARTPASDFDTDVKKSTEDDTLTRESRPRRHQRTKKEMMAQYTQRRRGKRTSTRHAQTDAESAVATETPRLAGRTKRRKGERSGRSKPRTRSIGAGEWEVGSVVGFRIDAKTHERLYEVKWQGFPSSNNSWEPEAHLSNCRRALSAFKQTMKHDDSHLPN
jgi:hypothetical protein